MFAIAAFAIGGMMVTPAFAATIASANTSLTMSGSVTTDSETRYGCDATRGQSQFTNSLTVVDGSDEGVTVEYSGGGCSDIDSVKVKIRVNNTWVHDQTYYPEFGYGIVTVKTPINSGDYVIASVVFYD